MKKYGFVLFFSLLFFTVFSQELTENCGFPSLYFDGGSSMIRDEHYYNLAIIADFLLTNPTICLGISGYDDKSEILAAQRVNKTILFFTKNFCISEDRFVTYTALSKASPAIAWTTRRVDFSY